MVEIRPDHSFSHGYDLVLVILSVQVIELLSSGQYKSLDAQNRVSPCDIVLAYLGADVNWSGLS